MKDFSDFLNSNKLRSQVLADMLIQEYDKMDAINEDLSRIVAASMITMKNVMDMRLEAYHKWLASSDDA